MGTLIQDLSRVSPAPTKGRETAVFVVSAICIVAIFGTLMTITDKSPVLYGMIGAGLLLFQFGRLVYVYQRGDLRS
ncbi:hypothetical protein [Yimella sp. cx-51]|uniref:hypothetical protein n=1 Tax=Yimella sp. cx-51 TaxID=2770551 RepID=UPI00165D68E2|nr:hypothetical protein [Yimella sp. cx-51]MBC9956535.1 hypothetical protein [Yimella sp. cx-51]QTH38361.1 hypothetical protein J5M86_01330 [Yimella sp. cx-51]